MRSPLRTFVTSGLFLALASGAAFGQGRLVATDAFAPQAGWALESDDAFILTRAGCIEPLTRRTADGALEPALAVSWERLSPTAWDFTLREGVTFGDGTTLTAEIVAEALNRVLSAAAPPRAFSPKRVASVTAIDQATVRIETPAPSVLLPMRMSAPSTGILGPGAFAGETIDPVGHCVGPFEITEYVPQQALKLKRNESYWGGEVKLAEGELRFIPEGNSRATQLRTGEAQISLRLPITDALALADQDGIEVRTIEQTRTTGLYLNTSKAPFDDERVRKGIQHAIDAAAIAASIYEGAARPAVGPFAPGDPWAPEGATPAAYDVAKARALLEEAGAGARKLTLLAYVERAELPDLATVIQAMLGDVGLDVELKVANYGAIEPEVLDGSYDMLVLSRGYLSDVPDPIGFLTADYSCEGGYNLSHFCDPAVDAKIEQAAAAESAEVRYDLYKELAKELQARAVTVYIVHQQRSDAVTREVEGYEVHPDGHYVFTADLGRGG